MFSIVVQAALGVTAIILLFLIWRIVKSILIFLAIPGPPTDWLFRHEVNEFTSSADQVREFKIKWQQRYPRICRYFVGGPLPLIALAHPESIKEFVKHKPPKPKLYKRMLGDWLGDGLLISSGNKWFRHRRMLTPAFHYNILNTFMSIYVKATHVMLQQWKETEQKDGYIVLQNSIPYLSLDILLQCIGSLETNCQIEKENIQYVRDVQELTAIAVKRYSNPLYMFDWYFYTTQDGRNFRRACSRSRKYTCDLIHQRKQVLLQSAGTSRQMNDFLSILLTTTDENGKGLTNEEICNEVDTFVFEGHDTTATALLWVFYYLGKFPKFQEMCRKEVMGCVGENTLTIEDLSQLEFVSMFIKESLRLHPPVYAVARDTEYPITIDGYELPKGTLVQMSFSQLHLNAEFWPDPFTFDPYRFSSENLQKVNPYAYLPFSVGERNCIGQNFAMHEMKSVVSIVLKKYEIELHPSISETSIIHKRDILFKPETPLKFYLKEATF